MKRDLLTFATNAFSPDELERLLLQATHLQNALVVDEEAMEILVSIAENVQHAPTERGAAIFAHFFSIFRCYCSSPSAKSNSAKSTTVVDRLLTIAATEIYAFRGLRARRGPPNVLISLSRDALSTTARCLVEMIRNGRFVTGPGPSPDHADILSGAFVASPIHFVSLIDISTGVAECVVNVVERARLDPAKLRRFYDALLLRSREASVLLTRTTVSWIAYARWLFSYFRSTVSARKRIDDISIILDALRGSRAGRWWPRCSRFCRVAAACGLREGLGLRPDASFLERERSLLERIAHHAVVDPISTGDVGGVGDGSRFLLAVSAVVTSESRNECNSARSSASDGEGNDDGWRFPILLDTLLNVTLELPLRCMADPSLAIEPNTRGLCADFDRFVLRDPTDSLSPASFARSVVDFVRSDSTAKTNRRLSALVMKWSIACHRWIASRSPSSMLPRSEATY